MKIITNKEYQDLLIKAKANDSQESKKALEDVTVKYKAEIEVLKNYYERKISNLTSDHDVVLRRIKESTDVVVLEKTREINTTLAKITSERDNYKKECEILTKAFENLGFDVKDMKEILNKLVDGIVSKNTIQLVK